MTRRLLVAAFALVAPVRTPPFWRPGTADPSGRLEVALPLGEGAGTARVGVRGPTRPPATDRHGRARSSEPARIAWPAPVR
jgi:hypothetical protein